MSEKESNMSERRRRRRRRTRTFEDMIRKVIAKDRRYPVEAYRFVYESLDYTLAGMEELRHVRGAELLDGAREYAIDQFGLLARPVLSCWNIRETLDFGNLVFNLVDAGLMGRTTEDKIEDFTGVYDFEEVFERQVEKNLSSLWRPDLESISDPI